MQQEKTDIKSMNLEELKSYMESIGEKPFRAKQLYQWMHEKQAASFDEMTNLSKSLQEKLKNECRFVKFKAGGGTGIKDRRYQKISVCIR